MITSRWVLFLLASPSFLGAYATLPRSFGSNMVVQRDKPLHVWGWAAAGEGVTLSFHSQSLSSSADSSGRWSLTLAPIPADNVGQSLTLQGLSSTVTLTNVVVGDVWLCIGQSNMEFPLNAPNYWLGNSAALPNGVTDAANANLPDLRVLLLPSGTMARISTTPLSDLGAAASWAACVSATNTNVKNYSALGFYFCRGLQSALNIPIGMIQAAWGGTPAESYVSLAALQAEPSLVTALPVGTPVAATPHEWPTGYFNGTIHPLTPMTVKGILFDQGESNTNVWLWGGPGRLTSTAYGTLLTVMLKDWRSRFGEDLPFINLQMQNISFMESNPPPVNKSWADNCNAQQSSSNGWGDVRWGEFEVLDLTNTAMSVNYDLNPNAMYYHSVTNTLLAGIYHPPNREAFALRMLPLAKNLVYHLGVGPDHGPLYRSFQVIGSAVQVTFDQDLATIDGLAPRGFMVGDGGGTYAWADSITLSANTALVSSGSIASPSIVKYAWGNNPSDTICAPSQIANLSDLGQVWLASPFQTLLEPVARVEGNSLYIRDSDLDPQAVDGRDFGALDQGLSLSHSFSLLNTGNAALVLSGGASPAKVSGPAASDFSVTVQPASSVAAGSFTNFSIQFQPGAAGLRRAVIYIPNNDPNRTPYYLHVQGTGNPLPSPTQSPTSTPSPSSTFTPAPDAFIDGPLQILDARPFPNPNPLALMVKLAGPADRCRVLGYSSGMAKAAEWVGPGRNSPGWVAVPLKTDGLSNGIYNLQAWAERGAFAPAKSAPVKVMILK